MRPLILAPLLCLAAAAPAQERSFMVSGFERLRVDGPFEVEVARGSPRAVALGDGRALDRIAVRVEGGTMVVSAGPLRSEMRGAAAEALPKLRVSVPGLSAVAVNGGGRVRVAEMRGTRLDLSMTGAGSLEVAAIKGDALRASLTGAGAMTLGGTTARARIRSRGAGSVDASALTADEADLVSESSGDISINVRYSALATALGTGGIRIAGNPECRLRGPGPMTCAGTIRR
jgi:hypothetical protein